MAQLTLWQTTDPFRCISTRKNELIIECSIHYLPLWLLSNFLHKGVLLFTTIVYSWRMQLISTSRTILRSVSGCSLINASFTCVVIALLSPLVCISNDWPALQHLTVSLFIILISTSSVVLHFIPSILNSLDEHHHQIVRVRQPDDFAREHTRGAVRSSPSQQAAQQLFNNSTAVGGGRIGLREGSKFVSSKYPQNMQNNKAMIRLGASRDILCSSAFHQSMDQWMNGSMGLNSTGEKRRDSRGDQVQLSNLSSNSTEQTSNNLQHHRARKYQQHRKSHCHVAPKENTRIRKSFSMNDMKSFLAKEKAQQSNAVDSRSPITRMMNNQQSQFIEELVDLVPTSRDPRQLLK